MHAFALSRVPAATPLHLGTIPPDKDALASRLRGLWGFLRVLRVFIEDIYIRDASDMGRCSKALIVMVKDGSEARASKSVGRHECGIGDIMFYKCRFKSTVHFKSLGFKKLKLAKGLCTRWCNGKLASAESEGRLMIQYKLFIPHSDGHPSDLEEAWLQLPHFSPPAPPSPESAPLPTPRNDTRTTSNKRERLYSSAENPSKRHKGDHLPAKMDIDEPEKAADAVIDTNAGVDEQHAQESGNVTTDTDAAHANANIIDISDSDDPDDKKKRPSKSITILSDDEDVMKVDTETPVPKCDHSGDNEFEVDWYNKWFGVDVNMNVVHMDEDGKPYTEVLLIL